MLHPTYYRHIYQYGLSKFKQFAVEVWQISEEGKSDEQIALEGIDALEKFIHEIGLPSSLKQLGLQEDIDLKKIADSCNIIPTSYKPMTHEEIYEIFKECWK